MRNAVFIWIPKTAGTSVYELLRGYGCPKLKSVRDVRLCFPQRGLVTFGHLDYRWLVDKGHVSREFDRRSYKFCFTRNPFTRAVSLFNYVRRQGRLHPTTSFLDFCRTLRDGGFDDIGAYNASGLSQCSPQVSWLRGVELDFRGRFESLQTDVSLLFSELGLEPRQLPHRNPGDYGQIESHYCDESLQIVQDIYSEDFATLGYDPSGDPAT